MEDARERHSRILRLAALGAVLLAAALLYLPVLDAPFTFDDWDYVVENPAIGSLSQLASIPPPRAGEIPDNLNLAARTRFLPLASFTLTYQAFGLAPRPFHLGNIALHLVNIVVVYMLITVVLRAPRLAPAFGDRAYPIALGAALLFAAHPIQTGAVAYVSQRFTLMGALWYALAVLLYLRYRAAEGRRHRAAYYLGAFAATSLGMVSKEFCFTIPLMIALFEVMLFTGHPRGRLARLAPFFVTLLIIPLTHIDFSHPLAGALEAASHIDLGLPRWKYLIVEQRVHMTFLRLLILPINQTLDYDYRPTGPGFVLGMFAATVVVGAALVWAARAAFGRGRSARAALAALALLWYYLAIAVESTFIPLGDVIFEHRLYLPLILPAAAVAALADDVLLRAPRGAWRAALACGLALAVALLMTATFKRSKVWSTELSITADTARKAPMKSRTHNNHGLALEAAGLNAEALDEFRRAVALDPLNMQARGNLADLAFREGMYEVSLAEYEFLQEAYPDEPSIPARIALIEGILGGRTGGKTGESADRDTGGGSPAYR